MAVLTVLWPFGLPSRPQFARSRSCRDTGWRDFVCCGHRSGVSHILDQVENARVPALAGRQGQADGSGNRAEDAVGASDENLQGIKGDMLAEEVPFRVLVQSEYLKRFILTAGYYFFGYFGYYGICPVAAPDFSHGLSSQLGHHVYVHAVCSDGLDRGTRNGVLYDRKIRTKAAFLHRIWPGRRGGACVRGHQNPRSAGVGRMPPAAILVRAGRHRNGDMDGRIVSVQCQVNGYFLVDGRRPG